MEYLTKKSNKVTIFPLFSFQLSETPFPKTSKKNNASNQFIEKIKKGFKFSNEVILRLIRNEEIDKFRGITRIGYLWGDGAYLISLINPKTFVFEVRGGKETADRLTFDVLLAMRLYKTGSVFCKIMFVEEDSEIIFFGSINPPAPYRPSKYELKINEIEEIDKLTSRINKLDLVNKLLIV